MNKDDYIVPPEGSTACFTGHRVLSEDERQVLKGLLPTALETFYADGYRFFLCGGALGFDTLAAQAVLQVRRQHPDVRLHVIIPCASQCDRWAAEDQRVYREINASADQLLVLSDFYYAGCMLTRNRFMVDHASLCIGYMTQVRGGTWSTVRYALQKERRVVNLAVPHTTDGHGLMKEYSWNYTCTSRSASENANTVHLHPLQQRLIK